MFHIDSRFNSTDILEGMVKAESSKTGIFVYQELETSVLNSILHLKRLVKSVINMDIFPALVCMYSMWSLIGS